MPWCILLHLYEFNIKTFYKYIILLDFEMGSNPYYQPTQFDRQTQNVIEHYDEEIFKRTL